MLAIRDEILDNKGNKLHPVTQKTLELFVEKVRGHAKENLSQAILFGSVARGEANEDSDIDVLVILKESSFEKRTEIINLSSDVQWDMDFDENAYLQPITVSEDEFNGLDYYFLRLNVENDGVILYDVKK